MEVNWRIEFTTVQQIMRQNTLKTNNFSEKAHDTDSKAPRQGLSASDIPLSAPAFPATRMRRNRKASWTRDLVRENSLQINDLIWPTFVIEGSGLTEDVPSMPGVQRFTIDKIIEQAKHAYSLGLPAIAIFPVTPAHLKDPFGREAINPDNLICRCVREVKDAVPDIGVISDIALDPYTDHGHDGLLEDGEILNDPTLEVLAEQALVQARAGVDVLAPSDMMDGRIGAIRNALDQNGHENTQILSYAVKYASSFYGPFRDAVQSGGFLKGDKSTYQMDPANSREALREVELDLAEGADMVMIKPGLPYLDIVSAVKSNFQVPTLAYNVSGEYAMLKLAADNGCLDFQKAMMETLICFKRAGADSILSYFALEAAKTLDA